LSLTCGKENKFSLLENKVLRKTLKPAEEERALENYTRRSFENHTAYISETCTAKTRCTQNHTEESLGIDTYEDEGK
jgi:hypothetical protein